MLLAGDHLEVKASLCPPLDCLLCQDSLPANQLFLNDYSQKGVSKRSKCHYFEFAGIQKDYLKTPIYVILNLGVSMHFSKSKLQQKISPLNHKC